MRVHAPSCSQSAPALPEEAERALQAWVIMAVCWGLVGVAMVRNGEPGGGNALQQEWYCVWYWGRVGWL